MSFRLVPKSVTLNDPERCNGPNGPYFLLFHRICVRYFVVKQLLGLPRCQNLLLIVYEHDLRNYSAIIWAKQTLITRFHGRTCIDG